MVFLSPFSDYTILRQNLLQIHVVFCLGAERVQHFSVLVMLPRTRIAHSLAFEYVRQAHKRAGLGKNDCQRWFHQAKEIEEGRGGEEGGREIYLFSLPHSNELCVCKTFTPPQRLQRCYAKAALCSMRMRRINRPPFPPCMLIFLTAN